MEMESQDSNYSTLLISLISYKNGCITKASANT